MSDSSLTRYYDNTRLKDYKTCPRYYYLRHVRHFVRDGTKLALIFGLSWHEAMNVVWGLAHSDKTNDEIAKLSMQAFHREWIKEGLPAWNDITPDQEAWMSPRTPAVAAEMLFNYIAQRRPWIQSGKVLSIERPFAVPLDPADPNTYYIGRLDKVFELNSEILVIEHKTTTMYKKEGGFRDEWRDSWSPNSQIDGYSHASHMIWGKAVRRVLVDGALVHKQVHDKFVFVPVERQFEMLDIWLEETKDWIERVEREKSIYAAQTSGGQIAKMLSVFPKNTESCGNWGGCVYRDICRFTSNPDTVELPAGYKIEKWEPFDILKLNQLGMQPEKEDATSN